jgi:hypothetical protein
MCYQTAAFPPEPEDAEDHRHPVDELALAGCQGNRLNGSASSSVVTGASGFLLLRGQG